MSAHNSNGLTLRSFTGTTVAVNANDDVIVTSNAASIAVSMPAASTMQAGKVYRFSNQGAGVATVSPASGTIDGLTSCSIAALSGGVPGTRIMVSDGTNWFSIASH